MVKEVNLDFCVDEFDVITGILKMSVGIDVCFNYAPQPGALTEKQLTPSRRHFLTLQCAIVTRGSANGCILERFFPAKQRAERSSAQICCGVIFLAEISKKRRFTPVAGKKASSAHQRDQRQQIFSYV